MSLDLNALFTNIITQGKALQSLQNQPRAVVIEDNPQKTRTLYVLPDGTTKEEEVEKSTPSSVLTVRDFMSFMCYIERQTHVPIIKIASENGNFDMFCVVADFEHRANAVDHKIKLCPVQRPELRALLGYPRPLKFSPRDLMIATTNAAEFLDTGGKALPGLLSSVSTSLSKVKTLDQNSVTVVQAGGTIRIGVTLAEGQSADKLPARITYTGPLFLGIALEVAIVFDLTFEVVDGECEFTLTPSLMPVVMHDFCERLAEDISGNEKLEEAIVIF